MKHRRLREEFGCIEPLLRAAGHRISLEQYIDACSVVMSRIQPWWGGSLVPFVDQAHGLKRPQEACSPCRDMAPGQSWPSTHRIPAQRGAGAGALPARHWSR